MSSQTAVESRKRGLLEKIEKMNGFFGGWQSLLRGRTARNKRLKKERKLARESRLASFGREFRGRLMLEPLEERIVPASVVLLDGQAALFDGPGGSILVVAVAGNSALDGIEVDYTQNAGADTINEIGLIGDGTGSEIINAQIFTNFGKTEAGGTLIFNDVDAGGGSTSTVARTAPDADTWNVTIATGQAFTDGGVNIINIGTKSFSFAGRDFRDTPGDTGAIAAIGSDVDAIDMDASAATVNFVNATVGGNLFYAVQIPAAGSADKGDLDIFTIDGELGTSSTIYLEGIGSIFGDLNVTDADGTGNFDVNTTGNDYGKITINDFGEATHRVDLDVSDYSLGGIINIISTGSLGTFGTLGTITTRALSGSSDPVNTYIDIVGTVGSITTINAGTVENDLKMVDIDDAVGTVLNVGGRITGIMDADDDADGSGSFGNITVTNAAGLADGITAGGITAGNGIGNIIVTGDIDSTAPIITATGNIGNITVTGDIDAAITATAGSIGSVQASSDITGALTAGTSIGNITATTGNITGAIVAGSSIGNITAGTAITSPAITAGTGSIGSILAQAGSITSAITAGGTIGTITATGAASDITGNIIAANGIGAISAGQDITSGTINGNSDGDTNGTGIASITAGRDINVTTITTDDGADAAPTGPSIGDITAGGDITITNLISGGDLSNITAGGSDGDITIVKAEADGDIDVVTTTGTGTLTGLFIAYAATASSPIASFIDAGTGTGTVYTIDVTGPFTSAAIYFGIGLGFGATPDVGMMNVTGTTSATDLYIYTASVATPTDPSSSSALVDLIGIDVDDSNNLSAGPPFFNPFPWAVQGAGANNDGNVTPEKEANLGTLTVDGWLGVSDGTSSGPGYIDFDTGAAANNLGDISSMFFEGGVIPLSVVEAESLGAFGLEGNLANLPNFSLVEVTVTEALNVVITAPAGSTAGYFFTTDVTKPFGEAIYVTAHATQAATATIDYIDGNDDGVVLGNNVGGAGDGFIVGNVQLPAWGFESTVGVASITETGENPAPGVPIIGFIEVAGPLGTVTVTDSNTANGIPADVWSISVGFNIGIPGVDDPVVPGDFLEANATDDVAGNNNGVWMANSSANLTSVQIDGDLGNAAVGTDVALAVTGSVGVAGSNAIRLRSFGTAGNSDLAGDVLIGDDLLGHVIVDGEIDNDGLNDIFAVGVAKKGETVVGTWNTVNFASGFIGSALNPVTFQANTSTGPGPAAINNNDVDIDIVAADSIYATIDAADDVDGDIVALTGSFTGIVRTRGADFGTGNDGDIRGDIIAGTFINAIIAAAVDPATGNPLPGTVSGDIIGNTIRSGNGDIIGLIAAYDDIENVQILAGNDGTGLTPAYFTTGNMLANIRAGVGDPSGDIDPTTIAAAGDVGATDGSTDIVASGNIEDVTIVAGAAAGLAGNMNADILAGVTGAIVGLAIHQTTGAISGGSFDGTGYIRNVVVIADGRVGTADGLRNIAAADDITKLAVIAEGDLIDILTINALGGPQLGGTGITGSGSGLEFVSLGDNGAETDQNVLVDIIAGADPADDSLSNVLNTVVVLADNQVGFGTEGFNNYRADGSIGDQTTAGKGVTIFAGLGDLDGNNTENIYVNILAGLEIDRSVSTHGANIDYLTMLADDDIGAVDGIKDIDGIFATFNINNLLVLAGTGQIGGRLSPYSSIVWNDIGGNVLINIEADAEGNGAGSLGDVLSNYSAGVVAADNSIGEATEGFNVFRAGDEIYKLTVDAGASDIFGWNIGGDQSIYVDILAGFTSNDPTSGDSTSDIIESIFTADDNIGTLAQDNANGVAIPGRNVGIDGLIMAARSLENVTIAAGTGGTSIIGNNDPGGSILVNIVAVAGSIETASDGGTIIEADDDIGASTAEGTNIIYAGTFIGINNGIPNNAGVTPLGFNVRIDAGNSGSSGGSIYSDIIANGGDINDVLISADDDIGLVTQSGDPSQASSKGVIRARDDIRNTVIQAGSGTQGRTDSRGGNIYVNIIAGFDGTGSIYDPVVIEADDDVGASPEGTNIIFAATNIGQLVGVPGGTILDNYDPSSMGGFDVAIDAGNSISPNGNVFTDIIALNGNIIDTVVTADDNIGSPGQILGSSSTETRLVPDVVGTITITIDPDQIDSDGLALGDNPQGIIQAGDYIEGLTVVAGERAIGTTDNLTGGSILVSIIAGADGTESGQSVTIRDLVGPTGLPKSPASLTHPSFDGINALVILADDDIGEPRANNIISAADSIDITDMRAGINLNTTSGFDTLNTASGQPDTAGDVSMDIIAGTRLFGPAGSDPDVKGGIVITSGPSIIADSGLPFALNINDSNLPGPSTMTDDQLVDGDQITILNLDIAKGGIFVPDLASTTATQEGNGNLNGTFVAGSDLTLISADINGNMVGDDGSPGGRTLIAGASYSGNDPYGVFLTVQITIPGIFTGPFSAGTLVPFDMGEGSFIGTNAGPFQAGTVITLGTIQGEIQAGRFDGSGNGVVADGNGITLEEVLSGEEGLADANFVPTTTFGATGDIRLDLLAIGRPYISPQSTPGQEPYDYGDGDYVNFSMFAMNSISNDVFFTGPSGGLDDPKSDEPILIPSLLPSGITANDAINLNFILANADAITAIDETVEDPSTPSTLKPHNSAYGNLSVNITARGYGDGAEKADGSSPDGISGGPIAAGFDPFVLIDTTVLPSNAPAGSVLQDPKVPANAFGSRFGNAFGFGNITGNIYALDSDATDGLEQGDITVTWIAAGEDIDGNIGAQDDIAMTGDDGTEGALLPGVDLDIAAGLSSNGLLAAFGTRGGAGFGPYGRPDLFPGGDIDGNIIAGDDIFSTDATGDDAGLIFIAAQGGFTKGDIEGNIVSGAEDQLDNEVFVPPVGSAPVDATGGLGSNIRALIIASVDVDGSILAGDPFGQYDGFFYGVGGGGLSNDTGAYYGSFIGTVLAGAGLDMIIDNFNPGSPYNLDNYLDDGDISRISADTDITLLGYEISTLGITLNGAIAMEDIDFITAGWGDPTGTGIITGDITAGRDIFIIRASKRIGNEGDLIAAGRNIAYIQAGNPSSADDYGLTFPTPVPWSAPFDMPLIDSVGTVAADIFTGGTLDVILAGGGKGEQLTDSDVNNDGITGNLFLGEFSGQGDLVFGEAGQVARLTFNDSADKNIVEIPDGDLSASLDMILTDGGSGGVDGFTLTFDGTATGLPFSLDELIIADDLVDDIVVDQGSIGRLVIDDDAIDRLVGGQSARDAFKTTIPLPNMPAVFLQLYDGDLSRTVMSRQFNEDAASSVATVEFADMLADIIVRDDIGLGQAVGDDPYGVIIEGSMRNGATLRSLLGDIGNVYVGVDINDSDIIADTGSIGNIFVGDDMQGASGGVDIIADLGIGDIEVQDSIIGNVTIQAISGSIGDITVGTAVDAIGDPYEGSLTDADGFGIDGGAFGGVDILARDNIGNITVVHGDIEDVTIRTAVSYLGDIGNISVYHGDISFVIIEADGDVGNIYVGVLPGIDGLLGTEDDVILINDQDIGDLEDHVSIFANTGGVGNITVANDMGYEVVIGASVGGIGVVKVYGKLNDVDFWTAEGSRGGFEGLYVRGDAGDLYTDIDGSFSEITVDGYTGSILVGWCVYNSDIYGGSIGDIVIGIDPSPGHGRLYNTKIEMRRDIGDITVRYDIDEVDIISYDGSVGNIVAEYIDDTYVEAMDQIGDIVVLGIDDEGYSVYDLEVHIDRAGGRIGDIIAHGSIDDLFINNFDGTIGDIVSLNGSIKLNDLTIEGGIGDIYASEDIEIKNVVIEKGSLGVDGNMSSILAQVTDTSINKADPTLTYNATLGTWTVLDGLNRARPDGAPEDGIFSQTGRVNMRRVWVNGSVGDITAFLGVFLGDMGEQAVRIGGDLGNITAGTVMEIENVIVHGNVGQITAYGNPYGDYGIYIVGFSVGGNVAGMDCVAGPIEIYDLNVVGNVGDITAFEGVSGGYDESTPIMIGGNLGSVVSLNGDITLHAVVNGNIGDVYAEMGDIYDSMIYAGGNIGSFTSGTGVRAGNFIWDDVAIVAKGTIGVVEARVLGYSIVWSEDYYDTVVDDTDGIYDGVNDILIPDNDRVFDFSNDYLVFADSTGDNRIEISPIIQAYMNSVSGGADLLDDGKIDSQEALDIIKWASGELPDISDPQYVETLTTVFQYIFKEVEVIDVDDVVDVPDIVTVEVEPANDDFLVIIAEGNDPSASIRAIGRIHSTIATTSDLYVDATNGGIGELSSNGWMAIRDADVEAMGISTVLGDVGAGDTLNKAVIRAKTSIDTLRGDDALINLDIQVTGGLTVDPTKPIDQMITPTGGVGLVGGITSGGEIEITIVTGGSIGYTVSSGGSINNNYDAFGNIGSIIAKDSISGTYVAGLGYIGNQIIGTGQSKYVQGGVYATSGDIDATFKAGLGIGNIWAPLGNVSGSLVTGGVVKGEYTPLIKEAYGSDDDDFGITLDTSALKAYTVYTTLDTDPATPTQLASMTFTNSDGNSQTINVTGSASALRVKVGVAFGFVTDVTVTGSGSLTFDSTGDVGGVITVGPGASVSVNKVYVAGDLGGFVNINKNATVANIEVTENIGKVIGYSTVQEIHAGGSIGEVKSLWKDVKNVFAGEDIGKIFAYNNVQKIEAQDHIGEIIAGKNVKIVKAYDIGTISALNVSYVTALGDIDLINAANTVTNVTAGGDIEVVAGKSASKISGASGKVSIGKWINPKNLKISNNLEIEMPPYTKIITSPEPPTIITL